MIMLGYGTRRHTDDVGVGEQVMFVSALRRELRDDRAVGSVEPMLGHGWDGVLLARLQDDFVPHGVVL